MNAFFSEQWYFSKAICVKYSRSAIIWIFRNNFSEHDLIHGGSVPFFVCVSYCVLAFVVLLMNCTNTLFVHGHSFAARLNFGRKNSIMIDVRRNDNFI